MQITNTLDTREAWLANVVQRLRDRFEFCAGETVPENVKVSCGFPSRSALSRKSRRIGECWDSDVSDAKVFEIFISPVLADTVDVIGVVAHELVHATVGLAAKHGKPFKQCAEAIGLEGRMSATTVGAGLRKWIEEQEFQPYPHAVLNASSAPKKQTTRMLKVECPECAAEGESYVVRMSASTFEIGAPRCPIHDMSMVVAEAQGKR